MKSSVSSRASPPCGAGFAESELKAMMLFRDAPAAIRDEGVDSLIVDQIEMAGGTVAEHLGLPFVSAAAALPINLDPSVPPVDFPVVPPRSASGPGSGTGWGTRPSEWIFSGVLRTINRQRRAWGLSPARELRLAVLEASPGLATARRPWNCRVVDCRPTSTTPAPGPTRRGGRRWTSPGPASTRAGPWRTPQWGRSRTGSSGPSG